MSGSYAGDPGLKALASELKVPEGPLAVWFELLEGVEVMNPLTPASAERLVAALRPRRGLTALDLGCGKGAFAVPLAAAGCAVEGVDKVEGCVRAARERARRAGAAENCRFEAGDASAAASKAAGRGGADIVLMLGVAFAWESPAACVRALAAALKPEGRLAFGESYRRPGAVEADDFPEKGALKALLEAGGLAVEAEFDDGAAGWEAYHGPQVKRARELRAEEPGSREALAWIEAERRWEAANLGWAAWICRHAAKA